MCPSAFVARMHIASANALDVFSVDRNTDARSNVPFMVEHVPQV